jgi:hypothetical protein
MVTLGAVYAWGQSGAWTPLLQSTSSLGDVARLVILKRNPSIGPFTEVVQGSDVMGGRSASDIWGMLLEPGFNPTAETSMATEHQIRSSIDSNLSTHSLASPRWGVCLSRRGTTDALCWTAARLDC